MIVLLISSMIVEALSMITQKYYNLKIEDGNLYTFQFLSFGVSVILLMIFQIFYRILHKEYKIFKPIHNNLVLVLKK